MAWTIIVVNAPPYIVEHEHNKTFLASQPPEVEAQAARSKTWLHITTEHTLENPAAGFVFGSDPEKCHILLPPAPGQPIDVQSAVKGKQFAIKFNTKSYAVMLRNLHKSGTLIRQMNKVTCLTGEMVFQKECLVVKIGDLELELIRYWADSDIHKSYHDFLRKLENVPPDVGGIRLLSSIGTSVTSRQKIYCGETCIASGKSASIYRAQLYENGDAVAVKRYNDNVVSVPSQELRQLKHPHIIGFHSFSVENEAQPELVTEYAEYGSLAFQHAQEALTKMELRIIFSQTLQALQFLHCRGIAHGNIKPGNILITKRNRANGTIVAKVSDIRDPGNASFLKKSRGTGAYAAPELSQASYTYTSQADIWSVGVVMLQYFGGLPIPIPDGYTTKKDHIAWTEKIVAHRKRREQDEMTFFLHCCLQTSPTDRATAENCLQNFPFCFPTNILTSFVPEAANQTFSDQPPGAGVSDIDHSSSWNVGHPPSLPPNPSLNVPNWNQSSLEGTQTLHGANQYPPLAQIDQSAGIANNHQLEAEIAHLDAVQDNYTVAPCTVGQTVYHFFRWRGKHIAHVSDKAIFNVTKLLAAADLQAYAIRNPEFKKLFRKGNSVKNGNKEILGRYLAYDDAMQVCNLLGIATTGLPHFLLQA